MPPEPAADASGPISLVLAGLVLVAAGFLGWRQWRETRTRARDLSPLDRNHFLRQDLRRLVGTVVLAIVAVAIGFGGRMPHRVDGRVNTRFIQLWAGVVFLILALLILAMLDWFSTHLYLRRHRQRLVNEGLSIVEAELRLKLEQQRRRESRFESTTNGHPPALGGD